MTGWVILTLIIGLAFLLIWVIAERPDRNWHQKYSSLYDWEK